MKKKKSKNKNTMKKFSEGEVKPFPERNTRNQWRFCYVSTTEEWNGEKVNKSGAFRGNFLMFEVE